ncbi:Uncharacterised protein [uncultured archaeon]|nr:Uncharacterised protein [uncultured archaeon]
MDYKITKKWLIVGITLMFFASTSSGISKKTTDTSVLPSLIKVTSVMSENSNLSQHSWQQINEDGFGDKHNVGTRAMTVFAGYLCVGVTNFNLSSNKVNGCELWCYNGTDWIQSVGNRSSATIGPGFGNKNNAECSILIEFKGMLYAGTANSHNGCELWRTNNPLKGPWEKVVDKGFGYSSNLGIWSAEIFMGFLYIGTINFPKGCQVWRTSNGTDFEAVVGGRSHTPCGFGESMNIYAWYMKEYNGKLLVGTQNIFGGEIWRSQDGVTWECLVGSRGSYPRSFQIAVIYNYGIRTLTVFKGCLYAGTAALPAFTVTLNVRGIHDKPHEVKIFNSPEIGLQIWRSNASEDQKWQCIVGGFKEKNSSGNGFGDNHNIYAWTMKVFNDSLYVGTYNVKRENISLSLKDLIKYIMKGNIVYTIGSDLVMKEGDGCQVWKTNDGDHWIQIIGNETNGLGNGFGDVNNNGVRSMSVYQIKNTNALIIGTINAVTGCEIWKYDEGSLQNATSDNSTQP